ncbi:MAG: transcriptional regulator [Henriciella sp.]|jgi:DNA-binding HxlR family transcriptional regulator|uniref:winged helix-turn-helix transcriptional regulator n=1 Tax=Henriciella sp. TaxID=1968823 RepID=UPI000C0D6F05|nr:helix-turn-helix domain-containing protein [Henriciella sp.]MBF33656.1 transcriptional regulator [Hyphomonadaceae bacterium]MBK75953.1 transcriptional regulator [Henriciella sp.]PHR69860.1 MAG: transcriptional regulator [Henriciella sp.]|tara:strand:- start:280 stop:627 length:348 start_codon:yes stop_codon:yes gene_type:complete
MKWAELEENWCPVARTLTVVGDRWTLLILRDCFLGYSKFEEFAENTGATRHILASRLKRLVSTGILERTLYNERPKRYQYVLTEKGKEFAPALLAFRDWGKKHMPVRRSVSATKE